MYGTSVTWTNSTLPGPISFLELARRLDEGQALDVADGAADFRDDDVGAGLLGRAADPLLDGLGHVRDDLHGAAEEIAAPLAGDERLIDGALVKLLARERFSSMKRS